MSTYAVGQHVALGGLLSRSDLNGITGEVIAEVSPDRYAVLLPSGEKIKVRPRNMRPSAEKSTSASQIREPTFDTSLYVNADGQFVQPLVVPARVAQPSDKHADLTKSKAHHQLPLPAGNWEICMVEQDADERLVTVTLVATRKALAASAGGETARVEGADSMADEAPWNKLVGLRITRTLCASNGEDVATTGVAAVVEGGLLVITLPVADVASDVAKPAAEFEAAVAVEARSDTTQEMEEEELEEEYDKENHLRAPPNSARSSTSELLDDEYLDEYIYEWDLHAAAAAVKKRESRSRSKRNQARDVARAHRASITGPRRA